ncbi:MAG: hypothetical protein MJZ13_05860 [Bacteroidales bacterium]|nr:hypothetical protein [Bacteroidales bacterium]
MAKHVINFHYEIHQGEDLIDTRETYFDLTDPDLKIIVDALLEKGENQNGLFQDIPATVLDKILGEAIDDARNHVDGDISDYKVNLETYIPLDLLYVLPEHIQKYMPEDAFNDPDTDADLEALRAEYL